MREHARSEAVGRILEAIAQQEAIEPLLEGLSGGERDALLLQLARSARRDAALADITNRVSDTLSLDVLFPRLMDVVSQSVGAERSTLFLYDAETDELFSRVMQGEVMGEVRFPAKSGIAGSVFATGEAVIIDDAYADARFNQEVDRRTGYRTRNILCVPIRNKRNQIIGVTQALNKRDGAFDREDQRTLEALTRQAAAALENARLFERVERQSREEAMLLDVVSAITSEILIDPLLDRILNVATELLDADRGALFLHDARTSELYSRVAGKLETREIRFPANAGIAGECFTQGSVINIPDAYADARFNQEIDRATSFRTRSILCMPITSKDGNKVGVMEILNRRGGPFGAADERRLGALCAQAAVSLENARLFDEVNAARKYNENILRSMSNAVLTLDAEERVIKVNASALRILRREEGELVGRTPAELFGGRNRWIAESLERVKASGANDAVVDTDLLLERGDAVSVNLTTVPLLDAADEAIGYMLMLEDITREKRLRSSMSRYMSKAVVDRLLDGGETMLGGTGQEVSVLFADIRGFTALSERLGARETVAMLNEYFTRMVDVVFEHNGILDKFIGDMLMAVFGSVLASERDADNAVEVGNQMMRALRELNARRVRERREPIRIGVGISTGEVVVGNIGSPKRLEYTVIGDRVNLAERLESANKHYGTSVLTCQFTVGKLRKPVRLREIDFIRVRGSTRPVAVYEALDHYDAETFPRQSEVIDAYAQGLRLYREREWQRAAKCFREAYSAYPDDGPSHLFWKRCQAYLTEPPPDHWDGVWTMGES